MDRTKEIKQRVYDLKQKLLQYEEVDVLGYDLATIEDRDVYNEEFYSNDTVLIRSEDDQLVYVYDKEDETMSKIEIAELKRLLYVIATREIADEFEAADMEYFLRAAEE